MTHFKVYSNPRPRRAQDAAPIHTVLQGVTSWLKGLLALLFHDAPPSPTSPGPRPKAAALFRGAQLSEDTEAVARPRAA